MAGEKEEEGGLSAACVEGRKSVAVLDGLAAFSASMRATAAA